MHHFYIDEYSGIKSPLHRIEARVKIIIFFTFILFIVLTPPAAYRAFSLYGSLILVLTGLSGIPWRFIFIRSLTIFPFVIMVAIFIPFLKRGTEAGGYSYEGITLFWSILIKAYLTIICVILLVSSTKFNCLLKAFEKMRLPKVFIMIMSFMYRYIFVIIDEVMATKQAKDARSTGGSRWLQAKASANILGSLFIRTYEKGESVYLAMCSRGFNGEIRTTDRFKISGFDIIFLAAMVLALTAIRIFTG